MRSPHDVYLDAVGSTLERVREANRDSIPAAARIIAAAVARGGILQVFGSGHSQLLALDLAGRAGGLAPVQVLYDPGQGRAERLEGYAATLLRDSDLRPEDCMIVISYSGRNPSPIEMAMAGREAGLPVIAVTAREFSLSTESRHSSGMHLCEVAGVVLDLCGGPGDAAVGLRGGLMVGPLSTVVGSALLHATVADAAGILEDQGVEPPVFASQNLDGTGERNAALRARYSGRVHGVV